MSLPRVLVFGHSHLGALMAANEGEAANDARRFEIVSYQFMREDRPHIVHLDGEWRYHPECEKELCALISSTGPDLVVSMLQGERATAAGLIAPEHPFEFHFPGEEKAFGPEAEIVPFDMLIEVCRWEHGLIGELLDRMRGHVRLPSVALSPPPPIGDDAFIVASNIRHADIGRYLRERGLPPKRWRYRVWKLHTLALRTIYWERGVAFADPPVGAQGEDGCLLREFWSDPFHANARYGHLLLGQIQSFLRNGS